MSWDSIKILAFLVIVVVSAKKDLRDYNDADLERLYEQWEEKDEPLEADELPHYKQEPPKVDFSNLKFDNPEDILKASKKGRTLMTFVTTYGKNKQETEEITALWQSSLQNSHIVAERYLIDDNRAIFMFKDGALAWEAKDYLVQQEFCDVVTIENKPYYGQFSPNKDKPKDEL